MMLYDQILHYLKFIKKVFCSELGRKLSLVNSRINASLSSRVNKSQSDKAEVNKHALF